MQEILNQLARLDRALDLVEGLSRMMGYFWAVLFFNFILTFVAAHRTAKTKDEIKLLRAYLEGQRSAKAGD